MSEEREATPEPHAEITELTALLTEKRRPLLAFIEKRLGPALRGKLEADDIFQEVSAEAVRAWNVLGDDAGDRFGWLCQLVERRIIDAHRRFFESQKRDAGREVSLGGVPAGTSRVGLVDLLVASLTTPTQAIARNDREARLLAALERLPAEQREALRLRYVDDLPSKEIAARLGKSDGAVRVMLTRALRALEELLGPDNATFFR